MWKIITATLILVTLFTFGLQSSATTTCSVTLEWDANIESDLAGYRIFMHDEQTSYDYNTPAWEGVETTTIISNLPRNHIYYFVARAFDTEQLESRDSNEVVLLEFPTPCNNQEPLPMPENIRIIGY